MLWYEKVSKLNLFDALLFLNYIKEHLKAFRYSTAKKEVKSFHVKNTLIGKNPNWNALLMHIDHHKTRIG